MFVTSQLFGMLITVGFVNNPNPDPNLNPNPGPEPNLSPGPKQVST